MNSQKQACAGNGKAEARAMYNQLDKVQRRIKGLAALFREPHDVMGRFTFEFNEVEGIGLMLQDLSGLMEEPLDYLLKQGGRANVEGGAA